MNVEIKNTKAVDISKLPKRISQPYDLTRNFTYTIHESRIMVRMLQQIKKHQAINLGEQVDINNMVTMRFRPRDLTVGNDFKLVYKALDSIRVKKIVIQGSGADDNGNIVPTKTITGMITEATYSENNSFVDIRMNADWFRYLTNLAPGFTPYLAEVGFQTSNETHFVIYQFISHWFKPGKFEGKEYDEEQIRRNFQIDKYKGLRHIAEYILVPCREELDKYADVSFNFTLNRVTPGAKRGRGAKIKSITFKFYQTKNKREDTNSAYNPKRVAVRISEFKKIYGFDDTTEQILGSLAKKYDLSFLSTLEYENRTFLRKQENFLDAFHKIIHQRTAKK
ncbi:RepB family plasmid replication initiator protein [Maribacter sp.]|uniref:RepB family plasmid replication initiator protein n=1 Tax=Maribacter sp. TaxID=1897614 RepID=UPI0025B7C2D6|nr:RepB family plasmid replication initiator protein [Maribacter sp.]|tara:strand:- start:1783 stop:2793 length:1011 start_codon:yes stop_codon:yes gene_type:complete